MQKTAPTSRPIHELIRRRWSARAIDAGRPVPREAVLTILEAARWAPSCFNEQPWSFLVFDDECADAREQARALLSKGNAWAKAAPVLILGIAAEKWARDGEPNRFGQHDTGLAVQSLLLQAAALGLVVHAMGGYDSAGARAAFGIPEGHTPMAMIAIGQPGKVEDLPDGLREKELKPRERKPLGKIAFRGRWGAALPGADRT